MSKPIIKEPEELDSLLENELIKQSNKIDFSKILKEYIDYLYYSVGKGIKICNKIKRLDKRYSLEKQEKDLLFELKRFGEHLKNYIVLDLPCINKIQVQFEVGVSSGHSEGDMVEVRELVTANISLEFYQPEDPTNSKKNQKYELEFNYYLDLQSEKGWH